MDRTITATDDEGRLVPCLSSSFRRQVSAAHHEEDPDERWLTLAKDDRALADNAQTDRIGCSGDPLGLLRRRYREHAGKDAARLEVRGGCSAVVGDGSPQLETAGDLLWVGSFDTAAAREVWRAAKHQVESFIRTQDGRITQVTLPDIEPLV